MTLWVTVSRLCWDKPGSPSDFTPASASKIGVPPLVCCGDPRLLDAKSLAKLPISFQSKAFDANEQVFCSRLSQPRHYISVWLSNATLVSSSLLRETLLYEKSNLLHLTLTAQSQGKSPAARTNRSRKLLAHANPKRCTHLASRRRQASGKKVVYVTEWQFERLCKCHSIKIKTKLTVNSNRSKLKSRVKHLFHEHNASSVFGTSN